MNPNLQNYLLKEAASFQGTDNRYGSATDWLGKHTGEAIARWWNSPLEEWTKKPATSEEIKYFTGSKKGLEEKKKFLEGLDKAPDRTEYIRKQLGKDVPATDYIKTFLGQEKDTETYNKSRQYRQWLKEKWRNAPKPVQTATNILKWTDTSSDIESLPQKTLEAMKKQKGEYGSQALDWIKKTVPWILMGGGGALMLSRMFGRSNPQTPPPAYQYPAPMYPVYPVYPVPQNNAFQNAAYGRSYIPSQQPPARGGVYGLTNI